MILKKTGFSTASLGVRGHDLFDFLKPKTKIRPEELGLALATVLVSQWLETITKHSQEYGRQVSNITKKELNDLWHLLLIFHCTKIIGVRD